MLQECKCLVQNHFVQRLMFNFQEVSLVEADDAFEFVTSSNTSAPAC